MLCRNNARGDSGVPEFLYIFSVNVRAFHRTNTSDVGLYDQVEATMAMDIALPSQVTYVYHFIRQ